MLTIFLATYGAVFIAEIVGDKLLYTLVPPGAPIREGGFEVTSVPVSSIPVRRRPR